MSENGRRPLLQLKTASSEAQSSGIKSGPAPAAWKCRPCGAAFALPEDIGDEDWVRCPACNARLGRSRDFRSEPPGLDKLRARPAIQRSKPADRPPAVGKLQVWRRRASSGGLRRDPKDASDA